MVDTWKSLRVGVMIVGTLVLAYGIYRLVDERASGGDAYRVWAVFEDAQGLVPKSKVLIAGIQVGYIDTIRLWGAKARVDIKIYPDVKLYNDATVMKRSASILGESLLALNPGTTVTGRIKDGGRIHMATASTNTDQVINDVGAIAASVRKVAAQLEHAFGTDESGQQMASALRNLTEALEGINNTIQENQAVVTRTLQNIEEITQNARPEIARILENVSEVTRDIRTVVQEKEDGQTGAEHVQKTLAAVDRASKDLEKVMKDIGQVAERTAQGKGTVGRLTSDEKLIDEVEGVAEDVGDFVGGISRLQTIVGLRSEYNMLANSFKSYVELRLQPREDKYYLIQLIDDPRGLTDVTQTTVRTSPPEDGTPSFYQETRVRTRNAFRFSLMFAKRVEFATFRFGLLETTGGVGVDLHFLDDHMEINTDLFAFGEQAFPRLRSRLAYEFLRRIWILGGVDDVLNDTADFFLGAQLRFNDEDLKVILPFAPSP